MIYNIEWQNCHLQHFYSQSVVGTLFQQNHILQGRARATRESDHKGKHGRGQN